MLPFIRASLALVAALALTVSALAQGRTAILSWQPSPSPGVTGYRVYQGTSSNGVFMLAGATTGLTLTLTNLATSELWFRGTAFNATEESTFTPAVMLKAAIQPMVSLTATGVVIITNVVTVTLP